MRLQPASRPASVTCTPPRVVAFVGAIWAIATVLGGSAACNRGATDAPGEEAMEEQQAAEAVADEPTELAEGAEVDPESMAQSDAQEDSAAGRAEREKPTQESLDAVLAELSAGDHQVVVTLPEGVDFGERLPTVVWFHGYNWHPGTATSPPVQRIANAHQVAFIGISATTFAGTNRYQWVEDESDLERVNSVLDRLLGEGPFEQSQMIAWGFSQGSTLSARLLAANPERWRGVIGLSSGAVHNRTPTLPDADLSGRHVFLSTGASERPHIVALTEQLAAELTARGATVDVRLIEGMSDHAMPPNFWQSMPALINGMI
ncbi:MAG: putative esterase [Bradymonadia bacterium]